MVLSDYRNEDGLELMADIMEPLAKIFASPELKKAVERKANKIQLVQTAMKHSSKEIIEILARIEGVPVEEYDKNAVGMTVQILQLLNDKEVSELFFSQAQTAEQTCSTSATESTKESEH